MHSKDDTAGVLTSVIDKSDLYRIARPPPLSVSLGLSMYVNPGGLAKLRL